MLVADARLEVSKTAIQPHQFTPTVRRYFGNELIVEEESGGGNSEFQRGPFFTQICSRRDQPSHTKDPIRSMLRNDAGGTRDGRRNAM